MHALFQKFTSQTVKDIFVLCAHTTHFFFCSKSLVWENYFLKYGLERRGGGYIEEFLSVYHILAEEHRLSTIRLNLVRSG